MFLHTCIKKSIAEPVNYQMVTTEQDLEEVLNAVKFAVNTSYHVTAKMPAFEVLFAMQPRTVLCAHLSAAVPIGRIPLDAIREYMYEAENMSYDRINKRFMRKGIAREYKKNDLVFQSSEFELF